MSEPEVTFRCPADMKYWSQLVFDGEYEVKYSPAVPPVILDIGANCGAFTIWALKRWPGARIHAYEPSQIAFACLSENVGGRTDVVINKDAVSSIPRKKLYQGANNCGEASFFPSAGVTDTYEEVTCVHPDSLPEAQILKIDTEGCECEILWAMQTAKRTFEVILLEYHSELDRRSIDRALKDYILAGSMSANPHRGTVKYIRRDLLGE